MLETLLSSILLAQYNYIYLTPTNKVAVEKRIAEKGFGSHPRINPSEIYSMLNLQIQWGKNLANSQIQCTWQEGTIAVLASVRHT